MFTVELLTLSLFMTFYIALSFISIYNSDSRSSHGPSWAPSTCSYYALLLSWQKLLEIDPLRGPRERILLLLSGFLIPWFVRVWMEKYKWLVTKANVQGHSDPVLIFFISILCLLLLVFVLSIFYVVNAFSNVIGPNIKKVKENHT